ncbi:MAG: 50S ribosomal protein L32 [Patescibacteria group bacterium]|nr:50S ribosomal protein L32 [Patescibacteria group bacterium]
MSVSKRRQTKSRKRKRASHFALKKVNISTCPKCKSEVLSHHACATCGVYKGKEVLKVDKKDAKKKAEKKK